MDNISEKFGVVTGPLTYEWTSYDDAQNKAGAAAGSTAAVPSVLTNGSDEYIRCVVHDAQCKQSVTVYFKRDAGGVEGGRPGANIKSNDVGVPSMIARNCVYYRLIHAEQNSSLVSSQVHNKP